jgi:hypothetical protein
MAEPNSDVITLIALAHMYAATTGKPTIIIHELIRHFEQVLASTAATQTRIHPVEAQIRANLLQQLSSMGIIQPGFSSRSDIHHSIHTHTHSYSSWV